MLVLTRKVGEDIVIGDNIHVTVVSIRGEKVSIGVTAPEEVVVDRQEVHDWRQNVSAGAPALTPTPDAVVVTTPP
jgi:carbon storage regulator